MRKKSLTLSTGLAMFSMFFGSGNLVFPLVVGQLSEGHYLLAALGILFTGVLVPFLGILALFLFKGDSNAFFSQLGRPATFWFPLIALSLMGPFGVLARCITVSHGAFRLLLPDTSLWLFSAVSCLLLLFFTLKKNKIIPLLGALLTPLLLLSLGAIVIFGLSSAPLPTPAPGAEWKSFSEGVFQGYQTMDLLAAFFFSAFVIQHLNRHPRIAENPHLSFPIFLKSAAVGAGLLSAVYIALVLLGSIYSAELTTVPPQEMLGYITARALGPLAAPLVAGTVVLACFTTALVLTSLFADFLRKEVAKDKIPQIASLAVTLLIAFSVSTLDFAGIAKFLGPILSVSYPALIVLTLFSIFYKWWGWRAIRIPCAITFLLKLFSLAI